MRITRNRDFEGLGLTLITLPFIIIAVIGYHDSIPTAGWIIIGAYFVYLTGMFLRVKRWLQ